MSKIMPLEQRVAHLKSPFARHWYDEPWRRVYNHRLQTANRQEAEQFLERKGPGAVGFVGELHAGKTYLLDQTFYRSKGARSLRGDRCGMVFDIDNLRTTKALAYGICTALSGGVKDYSGWPGRRLASEAALLARAFGQPIAFDNFPDLRLAGNVIDATLDEFLFQLGFACPLILCGRPGDFDHTMCQLPLLKSSIVATFSLTSLPSEEVVGVLKEFESAVAWPGRSFLSLPATVEKMRANLRSCQVGEFRGVVLDVYRRAIEADEPDLRSEFLKSSLQDHALLVGVPTPLAAMTLEVELDETIVTINQPEPYDVGLDGDEEAFDKLLPQDCIWRVPIRSRFEIPVIPEAHLTPAFKHRSFYAFEHGYDAFSCLGSPDFYLVYKSRAVAEEIAFHIFSKTEELFMNGDVPEEPFVGFPYGGKTRGAVLKALTSKVNGILPRFAANIVVTDQSRVCIPISQPYFVVSELNQQLRCRIETEIKSLEQRAMAFDYDDVEGVLQFSAWLARSTSFQSLDLFQEYSDTIVEHTTSAIPRNAFSLFVRGLSERLKKCFVGASLPKEVSKAFGRLASVEDIPSYLAFVEIRAALNVINHFCEKEHLYVGSVFGISLPRVALFRTCSAMGESPGNSN